MSRRATLPPILVSAAFSTAEAQSRGVTRSRLGRSDMAKPFRGVRVHDSSVASITERCTAYLTWMHSGHVFSHTTAAVLHGIPLPYGLARDPRLHATVPSGQRSPQMAGIIGHELRSELMDIEFADFFPVTSPLQTWLDLGAVLGRNDLVAVADFLCGGKHPRYQPAELIAAAARLHGRRGVRALREAASLARARVDSPKETETRLLILDAGLPEPVVGFEVLGVTLSFNPHVDLSWPAFKVCAEYEGEEHRTDRRRFRSDITRRERLEDAKWRVIRVTDDDLQNGGHELMRRIHNALVDRGWNPAHPREP